MDDGEGVLGRDLDGRVLLRRRRAADQQGHAQLKTKKWFWDGFILPI
jgi:hypothetical protein